MSDPKARVRRMKKKKKRRKNGKCSDRNENWYQDQIQYSKFNNRSPEFRKSLEVKKKKKKKKRKMLDSQRKLIPRLNSTNSKLGLDYLESIWITIHQPLRVPPSP